MAAVDSNAAAIVTASGSISLHARTQIRRAAASLLEQENGGAWQMVYQSRIDYPREVWPYLKLYSDREDVRRISLHSPHAQERTLSLIVVALIRIPAGETETIEDKMDAAAVAIEGYMTDENLRGALGFITGLDLQSTALDVVVNQDDKISHAELTLTYQVNYHSLEGMPDGFV